MQWPPLLPVRRRLQHLRVVAAIEEARHGLDQPVSDRAVEVENQRGQERN